MKLCDEYSIYSYPQKPWCGLVNDVRTRWVNRDPVLLKLIADIEATEKLVPEYLKKVA